MKNKFTGTLEKFYKRDESTGYSYIGINTNDVNSPIAYLLNKHSNLYGKII